MLWERIYKAWYYIVTSVNQALYYIVTSVKQALYYSNRVTSVVYGLVLHCDLTPWLANIE